MARPWVPGGRRFVGSPSAQQFLVAGLHLDRSGPLARFGGPIQVEGHRLSFLQLFELAADHHAAMEKDVAAGIARLDEADLLVRDDFADDSDEHV